MLRSRAAGLVLGMAADAAWGDPSEHHPVAAFGRWADAVEHRLYADSRSRGALFTVCVTVPVVAVAAGLEAATYRHPVPHALATAATTWAVVGARSLGREAGVMAAALAADDLPAARERLGHLCGRNPEGMPPPELARATVESVAENTNDAVVSPLLWGVALGIPGLVAHRCLNTLDAMVGHRNARYDRFGTASAVADDVAAWPGARATGLLACAVASLVRTSEGARLDGRRAFRIMRRDHARHPSPNGGWCESAWAGALGVQLGGRNVYFGRIEERGLLGDDGPRPDAGQVRAAARLALAVDVAATIVAAGALLILHSEG